MIKITLKASEKIRAAIPRFEMILDAYFLQLLGPVEDTDADVIELAVSASTFPVTRTVSGIAFDVFEDAVISINIMA